MGNIKKNISAERMDSKPQVIRPDDPRMNRLACNMKELTRSEIQKQEYARMDAAQKALTRRVPG